MSEQSIACVRASVLVYDDSSKRWIPSGSSGTQGLSKIQIFHHLQTNALRVVGRKEKDHEVVVNCAIFRGLNYNRTTGTFHQWRDKRQIYGLNFLSVDDAASFAQAMLRAIDAVAASSGNAAGGASASSMPAAPPAAAAAAECQPGISTALCEAAAAAASQQSQQHGRPAAVNGTPVMSSNTPDSSTIRQNGSSNDPVLHHQYQPQQQQQIITSNGDNNNHYLASNVYGDEKCSGGSSRSLHVTQQLHTTGNAGALQYAQEDYCYTNVSNGLHITPVQQQQQQSGHQRRSSQGSNGSTGSSGLYNNVIYSSCTPPSNNIILAQQHSIVNGMIGSPQNCSSPVATTKPVPRAPPPPPQYNKSAQCGVSAGQTTTPLSKVPAAPPVPPNLLSSPAAAGSSPQNNTLAQALASAKLRKISCKLQPAGDSAAAGSLPSRENRSASMGSVENSLRLSTSSQQQTPHSSVISEMAATLARRRMMIQESTNDSADACSVGSPTKLPDKDIKKSWDGSVGVKNGIRAAADEKSNLDSPKTHRKVPSGSSLSSQEDGGGGTALSLAPNGHSRSHGGSSASLINLGASNGSGGGSGSGSSGGCPVTGSSGHQPQRSLSHGPPSTGALFTASSTAGGGSRATFTGLSLNGSANSRLSDDPLVKQIREAVEEAKQDLMREVRQEINQMKKDIVEVLKAELSRR